MHNSNAKLGISVHLNDFTKGTTSGVEIYTPGNVDYTFAREAIKTIKDSSGLDYSKNTFCKVEEGIYTRLFSETDIKNVANKQAEQIIAEARINAEREVDYLENEISLKKKELEDIQREFDVYKAKMESLLISQLEILKEINKE